MLGVGLYVGWGVMFNIWLDVGVYAISVILAGFGLVGMLLYSYIERQELENNEWPVQKTNQMIFKWSLFFQNSHRIINIIIKY